ncbi:hypothetical protein V495_08614 [Pseudogymnoascus sp. VKM F-4514 (FW-929)]|nr:hypothetical protein V495_08614 [Pseudogymnoascus sp. VKM F-4514 (FW-929)]
MSNPAIIPALVSEKKELASESTSAPLADSKRDQHSPLPIYSNSSPSSTQTSSTQPQRANNMGVQSQIQARGAGAARNRPFAVALTVAVALYFAFTVTTRLFDFSSFTSTSCHRQRGNDGAGAIVEKVGKLVPLEAHVMSKCPDTRACLRELVLPAMERVSSKVDFTLTYLGRPTENDGVDCMHGPTECMGNILELCAAHLYPEPRIYLGFVMCLSNDYKEIPNEALVKGCALEHAVDFEKLNECAGSTDGMGMGLLRDSVQRSINVGVRASCTVRLNNEVYCVHDGDWKNCPNGPGVNDLVIEIEKLYRDS